MTTELLNRDVLERDPSQASLQNDGVSKVDNAATLHYELSTFVCDGEYERGLYRILDTYLTHLSMPTQPSAWVSGFYGSGKSHLVKILEALWRNDPPLDGQRPRDIARLPDDIRQQLIELSNEAKRAGGLWSASGMLTDHDNKSVRMLILGIVYKAAGLSSDYGRARFRLWVRKREWEGEIVRRLQEAGRDPEEEFDHYLVSPEIANAVWELSSTQSGDASTAQKLWEHQFEVDDISIDDFEAALREVLLLQSADGVSLPLTLIVLDEVQQYIGQSGDRAQAVQEAVERIQSAFESKVLVVATGQAALNSTANLQKLQGRFTVNVMLSDRDVEQVVRKVVLRKRADRKTDVEATVHRIEGEIDRHLQTTKIGPRSEDKEVLAADYPLLPTRGRFWASVLHALDPTGTSAQLRSQLRIAHSATVLVADRPLGHVIPGDFIFEQLSASLMQAGTLPREITTLITDLDDGSEDGRLRARLVQLIFLIERLPEGDISDIGVKATPETLADLLVEDLRLGSDDLRRRIPQVLKGLEEDGKLMRASDGRYAIQTGESLKWNQEFQKQRQALVANPGPLGDLRSLAIENLIREQTKRLNLSHGKTNPPRKLAIAFGGDAPQPAPSDPSVVVWVRDGWDTANQTVVADARGAGDQSPVISVFVPQRNHQEIQTALANFEAAKRTLDLRGASQDTIDGQRAADAVRHRQDEAERTYAALLRDVVASSRVYLGGGAEVEGEDLAAKLQSAVGSSFKRLFPHFADGDDLRWDKVFSRATQGNPDALKMVDYQGEDHAHPVVREIRKQIPGDTGILWSEVRKRFEGPPYGWPRDTVDGAVAVLVNSGAVNASRNGQDVRGKDLVKQRANAIQLVGEKVFPSKNDYFAVRKIMFELDGKQPPSDDAVREGARDLVTRLTALAKEAGGEPPLPLNPTPAYLTELQDQTGNQLVISLAQQAEQLSADIATWRRQAEEISRRKQVWETVVRLSDKAAGLDGYDEIRGQIDAIRDNRQLLDNPDPLDPVRTKLGQLLRSALNDRFETYSARFEELNADLKASDEWVRLDPARHDQFLAAKQLHPLREPAISSDSDLLSALSARSLAQWDDAIAALDTKFEAVRTMAIKALEPETVEVALPRPVMRVPRDVETWVAQVRQSLLDHVNAGHPVRIK